MWILNYIVFLYWKYILYKIVKLVDGFLEVQEDAEDI